MDADALVHARLRALGLAEPGDAGPVAAVRRLVAVQAQDYGPSKWSIGERVPGLTDAAVDELFDAGGLIRTHVLRPTWHLVTPADLRWLLALTAPRVHQLNAYYYRQTGLDDATRAASLRVVAETVADGEAHPRAELYAALAAAGLPAGGVPGAYTLMNAELERVICSGPRIGRQHSYALLDARVPAAPSREAALEADPEAALAELVHRFYASHGPATVQDLRAWASLTVSAVRRGIALAGDRLASVDVDGRTYWFEPPADARPAPSPAVHLLQPYDELLVGHAESKDLIRADNALLTGIRMSYNGVVILDGRVAGRWKRSVGRSRVRFDVQASQPFEGTAREALQAAADAQAAFLGAAGADVELARG